MPPVLHGQAAPRRLRRPGGALPAPLRRAQGREEVIEPERRVALVAARLKAVVDATAGPMDRRSVAFPGGAALAGDDGVWVFADVEADRSLGPALAIARRVGAGDRLNVVVDGRGGLLARRAAQFRQPPVVWEIDGVGLRRAEPDALLPAPVLDPRIAPFARILTSAGADPVVEHGRLIGEVEGLEVARVTVETGHPVLEVGVGRFDREAQALVSGDRPTEDALRDAVAFVRRHRTGGAEHHPLNLLAASRRLRARVVREPGLVGADQLAPMAPTVEPPDLRTPWPAPATGLDLGGRPMVVVCSVGVDLDLVPAAADVRIAAFPALAGHGVRLVLAVPARDRHPVTLALAAALAEPAEVVAVAMS